MTFISLLIFPGGVGLQTIDWVQKTEEEFFPLIAGNLGDSEQNTKQMQQKLDKHMPTVKVFAWFCLQIGACLFCILAAYRLLMTCRKPKKSFSCLTLPGIWVKPKRKRKRCRKS